MTARGQNLLKGLLVRALFAGLYRRWRRFRQKSRLVLGADVAEDEFGGRSIIECRDGSPANKRGVPGRNHGSFTAIIALHRDHQSGIGRRIIVGPRASHPRRREHSKAARRVAKGRSGGALHRLAIAIPSNDRKADLCRAGCKRRSEKARANKSSHFHPSKQRTRARTLPRRSHAVTGVAA